MDAASVVVVAVVVAVAVVVVVVASTAQPSSSKSFNYFACQHFLLFCTFSIFLLRDRVTMEDIEENIILVNHTPMTL